MYSVIGKPVATGMNPVCKTVNLLRELQVNCKWVASELQLSPKKFFKQIIHVKQIIHWAVWVKQWSITWSYRQAWNLKKEKERLSRFSIDLWSSLSNKKIDVWKSRHRCRKHCHWAVWVCDVINWSLTYAAKVYITSSTLHWWRENQHGRALKSSKSKQNKIPKLNPYW